MTSSPRCRVERAQARVGELARELPLPTGWRPIEVYVERARVCGAVVHLVGLSSMSASGREAIGSAASLHQAPVERAYYELVERAALLDAMDAQCAQFRALDRAGEPVARVAAERVFPRSPAPERWQYAKSNGVAAGATFADARARAERELVERDRVLRSWLGQALPLPVSAHAIAVPAPWREYYDFRAYTFPGLRAEPRDVELCVAGVFGFPRASSAPLVFGFGARAQSGRAVQAARAECVQRLGFLWGEPLPDADPALEPSAQFHQEYFLRPDRHEQLQSWLAGKRARVQRRREVACSRAPTRQAARRFVDLTPTSLRGKLWVVKALPLRELPLRFGRTARRIGPLRPYEVHPIP